MENPENPWLTIALSDYEAHMALPEIAQAQLLAEVFEAQLKTRKPASVAVLGCAGGNGLERIEPQVTRRVVAVDLNAHYLEQLRARYVAKFAQLELIEGDIQTATVSYAPVDLIFAALVLEYVDVGAALSQARNRINPAGVLVTVVQLPARDVPAVTPSPYTSLSALEATMHFVEPEDLRRRADANGLGQIACTSQRSPAGKDFTIQVFSMR